MEEECKMDISLQYFNVLRRITILRGVLLIMKELKPQFFLSMKGYSGKQFAGDLTAGVIVAIIALPLSIALALAAARYRLPDRRPHLHPS